jgi:hypothetical protein
VPKVDMSTEEVKVSKKSNSKRNIGTTYKNKSNSSTKDKLMDCLSKVTISPNAPSKIVQRLMSYDICLRRTNTKLAFKQW